MLDLIKINETTDRIPLVQNRRLSTSASASHIRPRSSYSLVNHSGLELASAPSNAGTVANSARNSLVTAHEEPGCGNAELTCGNTSSTIERLLQIRNELANNRG